MTDTPLAALRAIRALDYTIIITRQMDKMRAFYAGVMGFPVQRAIFDGAWVEYRVGGAILALSNPRTDDQPPPIGKASLQLAFRVLRDEVDACAAALASANVEIVSPPTDQSWGHRTLFFRDPDGNLLEIYADI